MDLLLKQAEGESIYILRETRGKFKKPAILWSPDKDSTVVLALCKKAFFGKIPFPVIHIDSGIDFPETYKFRDNLVKRWDLNLLVVKVNATTDKIPRKGEGFNSAEVLKNITQEYGFDALITGARRDGHGVKARESYFAHTSGRHKVSYVRVHPSLDWTELDVWRYIKENNIPVHPLYFAKNGKRYLSLGYPGATSPVKSNAQTVDDIIEELQHTEIPEGVGRAAEKEKDDVMRRLRELGYM